MNDTFTLGGKTFHSRFLLGTGKFSLEQTKQVIEAAQAEIVKLENISVDDETVEAEFAKLAENYKMEVEQVKNFVPVEEFKQDIAVNKAIDLVKETANITVK